MINISPAALSNIDLRKGRDPAARQAVVLQGQVAVVWSCLACVPTDVGCYLGQQCTPILTNTRPAKAT